MRRNQSGQTIQAMMRANVAPTSSTARSTTDTRIVAMANAIVTAASHTGQAIVVTCGNHGIIPGMIVTISGVGGNTAANGTFRVTATTLTTITLGNTTDGTNVVGNAPYTSGGIVTIYPVAVMVSKDGGAPAFGSGTLSHIGRDFKNAALSTDAKALRAITGNFTATASVVGVTQVTAANGGVSGSTLGLWSYTPTASETNAASVTFTFTSAVESAIAVSQTYEPTAGPIVLQTTIASVTNNSVFRLTAGSSANDTYNGALICVYDSSNENQVAYGTISDYDGTIKEITLASAPLTASFNFATSDYVTIIYDPSLKPVTNGRNLVVDSTGKVDLSATGLDSIAITDPAGVADTFPEMLVQLWRRFFKKTTKTSTEIKTFADDGSTVRTTQTVSDSGGTQTQGAAS